jgi:hypothetical protein
MNLGIPARLPHKCHYSDCRSSKCSPNPTHIVRKGFYHRSSDAKRIPRFFCRVCKRSFSSASSSPCFRQKRRKLNPMIWKLLASKVHKRRIVRLLGTTRRTVARKFVFLANQSELRNQAFVESFQSSDERLRELQFDEMESFERSKCVGIE